MGQQVNFYMTKDDEQEFLTFVKQTGNVELLPQESAKNDFRPIETLPEPGPEDSGRLFWLLNRSVSSNLVIDYDDENASYFIDGLRSSTVEFARCFVRENRMYPGRIWAEFTIIDSEAADLDQKERGFRRWFDTMANWIWKYYRTGLLVYAGRGALKFQDGGGILP